MASTKQKKAVRRKKPGTGGRGKYYRIVVRPKGQFATFRVHDVGRKGHIQRLAGKRKGGGWDTQAWLIAKTDAGLSRGILVGKTAAARSVISKLGAKPRKVSGNVFRAKPRKDIPERKKPTPAMRRAQGGNIKKAQAARRKKRRR